MIANNSRKISQKILVEIAKSKPNIKIPTNHFLTMKISSEIPPIYFSQLISVIYLHEGL